MFDKPAAEELPRIAPDKQPPTMYVIKWSRYQARNRLPCDDCKIAQHRGLLKSIALQARWKRLDGRRDKLLCHQHARHWAELDGDRAPKSMRGAE
jgi:hypothetical protein